AATPKTIPSVLRRERVLRRRSPLRPMSMRADQCNKCAFLSDRGGSCPRERPGVPVDQAITHLDHPTSVRSDGLVVGDHHDRRPPAVQLHEQDRKSTRLNSSHDQISYAVFCLKKKKKTEHRHRCCGKLINKNKSSNMDSLSTPC